MKLKNNIKEDTMSVPERLSRISRLSIRFGGCLLAAVAVLYLTPAVALATNPLGRPLSEHAATAGVAPINSHAHGHSYGEWSAMWWQWIYAFPANPPDGLPNPNFTNGTVDCSDGQSTHDKSNQVWFLAGNFGGTSNRSCTVPTGIALFIPVLNFENDNIGCCTPTTPPNTFTDAQLRAGAAAAMDNPLAIHARIDNVLVPVLAYRAQSPPPHFIYSLPAANNVYLFFNYAFGSEFTLPGYNWPSLNVPAVSDGYWLMLEPLSPGKHVINFGGITNFGFALDITYNIDVVPGKGK